MDAVSVLSVPWVAWVAPIVIVLSLALVVCPEVEVLPSVAVGASLSVVDEAVVAEDASSGALRHAVGSARTQA